MVNGPVHEVLGRMQQEGKAPLGHIDQVCVCVQAGRQAGFWRPSCLVLPKIDWLGTYLHVVGFTCFFCRTVANTE